MRRLWDYIQSVSTLLWLVGAVAALVGFLAAGYSDFPTVIRIGVGFCAFAVVALSLILVVKRVPALATTGARPDGPVSTGEVRRAVNHLITELTDNETIIERWIDHGRYGHDDLPSHNYAQYRTYVAAYPGTAKAHDAVADAYRQIAQAWDASQRPPEDWSPPPFAISAHEVPRREISDRKQDDLNKTVAAIKRARTDLKALRDNL